MTEKLYIHIRHWDRYQHRDVTRNKKTPPPWIMEYVQQLGEIDYLELTWSQRGLLHSLRLLYAANRGQGMSYAGAKRKLCTNSGDARWFSRNLEALNHAGFIVLSARKSLADCAQDASLDVDVDVDVDTNKDPEDQDQNPTNDIARPEGPTPEEVQNLVEAMTSSIKEIPW